MRILRGAGLSNLDIVVGEVRGRDRDRYLSVLYAPAAVRPALFALHGLDLELAAVVTGTTEPMIGEIRLAWWREALIGLDAGVVPAQPLLALLAAAVVPLGVSGAELAELEDRWAGLIGGADVPEAHIAGGGALFGWMARVLDGDEVLGRRLGRLWVTGEVAALPVVPSALRSLLGLVRLAQRDALRAGPAGPAGRAGEGREVRGSLARQWRLLMAIAFGR